MQNRPDFIAASLLVGASLMTGCSPTPKDIAHLTQKRATTLQELRDPSSPYTQIPGCTTMFVTKKPTSLKNPFTFVSVPPVLLDGTSVSWAIIERTVRNYGDMDLRKRTIPIEYYRKQVGFSLESYSYEMAYGDRLIPENLPCHTDTSSSDSVSATQIASEHARS